MGEKSTDEDILKQSLNSLDVDFSALKMQAQELMVRNSKNQDANAISGMKETDLS